MKVHRRLKYNRKNNTIIIRINSYKRHGKYSNKQVNIQLTHTEIITQKMTSQALVNITEKQMSKHFWKYAKRTKNSSRMKNLALVTFGSSPASGVTVDKSMHISAPVLLTLGPFTVLPFSFFNLSQFQSCRRYLTYLKLKRLIFVLYESPTILQSLQ